MQYTVALAGNPNSGKTTLFNELTGASAHVGNWPGVTVEKKEGKIRRDTEATLVDLPGIYSLSPYTLEEVVARKYLLESRPDVIINIVDASNLERNLYLTTQLLETGIPTVIACNMMDIVDKNGDSLNSKALSEKLGAPVVEISALRAKGLDELIIALENFDEETVLVINIRTKLFSFKIYSDKNNAPLSVIILKLKKKTNEDIRFGRDVLGITTPPPDIEND